MKKQKSLGRGLEALLQSTPDPVLAPAAQTGDVTAVPLDELVSGEYQPRSEFAAEGLTELADSIREQGVLQPLIVRPLPAAVGNARYEIVAGERRWRAARLAGLASVPVAVRTLDDAAALAVALIENLQREDLNPLDQARSLARLAAEFDLTHEEVAQAVGRSRAAVSNLLRLLGLDDEVKSMLAEGRLQMGHARALLPLPARRQVSLARRCAEQGLSVRQVEERVRRELDGDRVPAPPAAGADLQTRWLQTQLRVELGQQVSIRTARDGSFSLHVGFGDLTALAESLGRMLELVERVRETAGPRARESSS